MLRHQISRQLDQYYIDGILSILSDTILPVNYMSYLSDVCMVRPRDELLQVSESVRLGICVHELGLDECFAGLFAGHLEVLHQVSPVV